METDRDYWKQKMASAVIGEEAPEHYHQPDKAGWLGTPHFAMELTIKQ